MAAVDPPRDLVLTAPDGSGGKAVSWEHSLESLDGNRTRLILRGRVSSRWLDRSRAEPPAGYRRIFSERVYAWLARLQVRALRSSGPRASHHGSAALARRQASCQADRRGRWSTRATGLRKKDIMTAIEAFVTRHPVGTHFALAFTHPPAILAVLRMRPPDIGAPRCIDMFQ